MKPRPFLYGLLFAALISSAFAAPSESRAAQLDKLIAAFPAHVAGPITEHSDSTVRECYFKYRGMVRALTLENIADRIREIRESLDNDIHSAASLKDYEDKRSPATKSARRLNENWMRVRLKPYVQRLEFLQRNE